MARRFSWEYIVSTVLFSAGLLVLTATLSSPTQKTQAAPHAYNSTWEATRLLGVEMLNTFGSERTLKVPIGIAEWSVKGTLDNSGFKETWSVPGGATLQADLTDDFRRFFDHTDVVLRATNTTGFDPSDWLIAIQSPGNQVWRLYTDTVAGFGTDPDLAHGIACRGEVCMFNSGQYSFGFSTSSSGNLAYGETFAQNSISPLHWDVRGTYCDLATEPECQ